MTAGGAGFLLTIGGGLLVLALLARLAARTGFSPIPLYLLAGLTIGFVAPPDIDPGIIAIESQIAVILLLFMLGIEYTADDVVRSLQSGLGVGIADIVLNLTPGLLIGLALGWELLPALLLGGVTYISSSSIVAKVLDDFGRLGNLETPSVLSVLVIEDLAMAAFLPLVAVLLAGGSLLRGLALALAACSVAAVVLMTARKHGRRLSRRIAHPKSEVVLLTVVGLLMIAGGAAELIGVSAGVMAFLVGLAISGTLAHRARELMSPLRDLFAALFFVSFGLQIDVRTIPAVLTGAVLLWLVTAATKLMTGWLAARRTSALPGRLRAGTALIARGEFSIVIAGLGAAAGTESDLAPLAATYVLLTAITGPLLTRYAGDLGIRVVRRRARGVQADAPIGH